MPTELLTLKGWVLDRLSMDMVVGTIEWSKSLGHPEGDFAHAFAVLVYHLDKRERNLVGNPEYVLSDHQPKVVTGEHDSEKYRVTFFSDYREPRGYSIDEEAADLRGVENYVDVSLRSGVQWTGARAYRSKRILTSNHLVFVSAGGSPQRLPAIKVETIRQ